jgi:hypothetical protein
VGFGATAVGFGKDRGFGATAVGFGATTVGFGTTTGADVIVGFGLVACATNRCFAAPSAFDAEMEC